MKVFVALLFGILLVSMAYDIAFRSDPSLFPFIYEQH